MLLIDIDWSDLAGPSRQKGTRAKVKPDPTAAARLAARPDFADMPGVFVLSDRLPIGQAIEEILLIDECSEQAEWSGRVVYLPL